MRSIIGIKLTYLFKKLAVNLLLFQLSHLIIQMKMKSSNKPDKETFETWRTDPKNWKLGIFYFNKLDRRIFPPKRMQGMGWTVNFANPLSILSLFGLVIAIIALATLFQTK